MISSLPYQSCPTGTVGRSGLETCWISVVSSLEIQIQMRTHPHPNDTLRTWRSGSLNALGLLLNHSPLTLLIPATSRGIYQSPPAPLQVLSLNKSSHKPFPETLQDPKNVRPSLARPLPDVDPTIASLSQTPTTTATFSTSAYPSGSDYRYARRNPLPFRHCMMYTYASQVAVHVHLLTVGCAPPIDPTCTPQQSTLRATLTMRMPIRCWLYTCDTPMPTSVRSLLSSLLPCLLTNTMPTPESSMRRAESARKRLYLYILANQVRSYQ